MRVSERVLKLVCRIPRRRVSTYGEIARAARTSSRAVGQILSRCPDPDKIPCYRVVHSDSRIGGYALGAREKTKRLLADRIKIQNNRIIGFEKIVQKF